MKRKHFSRSNNTMVPLTLLLLLLPVSKSVAQQTGSIEQLKGWTLAPAYQLGKVWKHTPKFQPEINGPSHAFELNVAKQTCGEKEWQQVYHYPFLGFAIAYTNFGNDEVLGDAFSFMPNIDLPLVSGKKLFIRGRVGSGIAYLSKHYDPVENPTNNVIASHWNNITSLSVSGNWQFAHDLTLFAGVSLTHFSTGAVRIPNLGINIPASNIGLRYQPKPYTKEEFIKKELQPSTKKILFNVSCGIGFQEAGAPHGPMYHVFLTEVSAGKMIMKGNKLSAGVMGTYKEAANTFIKQQEIYTDNLFLNSCAASVFIKDDFLFGYVGISLLAGYNFYRPSPIEYGFYQKLGIPVYLPFLDKKRNDRFSIGVYVTAGSFTADFVSVDTGFQF